MEGTRNFRFLGIASNLTQEKGFRSIYQSKNLAVYEIGLGLTASIGPISLSKTLISFKGLTLCIFHI